jgi:hypothetical protein
MEYGLWNIEYGVWSSEYGIWSLEYLLWSMEYGVDIELGVWNMAFRIRNCDGNLKLHGSMIVHDPFP